MEKHIPQPLFVSVTEQLRTLIEDGTFPDGSQLPAEVDLSRMLGVSRVTLREGLRLLEEDGMIVRKHGIGTFVRLNPIKLETSLTDNLGLTEVITQNGFTPGVGYLKIWQEAGSPYITQRLGLKSDSEIIHIERVRTANELPMVYTLDAIPAALLKNANISDELGSSIYDFLENKCGMKIAYGDARVEAAKATTRIAKLLSVPANSVLIMLEQIDYSPTHTPILFTREWYVKNIVNFTIRRVRR